MRKVSCVQHSTGNSRILSRNAGTVLAFGARRIILLPNASLSLVEEKKYKPVTATSVIIMMF